MQVEGQGSRRSLWGNWKDKNCLKASKPVSFPALTFSQKTERNGCPRLQGLVDGMAAEAERKGKLTNPEITLTLKASELLHGRFHNLAMNDPKSL
ncbi:hypothetical protein llap_9682 [Limosa lapponica baueri]|uniref:Uncharacterized protein n=1 Tax=Limosa lapponica baueri TaxID=1758121 RepID=A0A2I0U1V4_LIMLA|nr:hypothetical protein llap_9682 [Limosa lapponica baueri]